MWTHSTNVLRKRKLVSGGVDEISDKIDSISCSAFSELTMQNAISEGSSKGGRAKIQPEYTSDGQPICLQCDGVGHMERQCTASCKPRCQSLAAPSSAVQEHRVPPSL